MKYDQVPGFIEISGHFYKHWCFGGCLSKGDTAPLFRTTVVRISSIEAIGDVEKDSGGETGTAIYLSSGNAIRTAEKYDDFTRRFERARRADADKNERKD